jgi:hypothetical protein
MKRILRSPLALLVLLAFVVCLSSVWAASVPSINSR